MPAQLVLCRSTRNWVYPRAGGGTWRADMCVGMAKRYQGLSPRRRGNRRRLRLGPQVDHVGSIPAQAGEPSPGDPAGRSTAAPGSIPRRRGNLRLLQVRLGGLGPGVYPRAGGGTTVRGLGAGHERKGSIPAQAGEPGSPCMAHVGRRTIGSIPAQAGEPVYSDLTLVGYSRVYPRAGGGTSINQNIDSTRF